MIERCLVELYKFKIKVFLGMCFGVLGVDKSVYFLRNENRFIEECVSKVLFVFDVIDVI